MKPLLVSLPFVFVFVFVCVAACRKNDVQTSPVTYLKARVANTHDFSCGTPILDFSEDSLAIRGMTNEKSITFIVISLPSQLNVQDKKLYVAVRPLTSKEEFPCLAIGLWYPHLKVIEAKER
jgi:hypothetical protein